MFPPLASAQEGDEVSYDLSTLLGKKCGVEVVHNESNGNTYVNIKDYVLLSKPTPGPQKEQDPLSKMLDDEMPF